MGEEAMLRFAQGKYTLDMVNLVLPPPERRLAADKVISPIAIDPPLLSADQGIRPWASLSAIATHAQRILTMAKDQGYWLHEGTYPDFALPAGRIVDLDFALASITSAWIEAYLTRTPMVRARGFGTAVYLAVDVDAFVLKHAQKSPLKDCLMNYWGKPFQVSARYPDNFRKPFLNNVRKLGAAGWITLTKPVNDRGLLSYLVAPSQMGLVRAVWIADITGTPNPIQAVLDAPKEQRAEFVPSIENPSPGSTTSTEAPVAIEADDLPRRQQYTKTSQAIRAQKRRTDGTSDEPRSEKPKKRTPPASTGSTKRSTGSSQKPGHARRTKK